MPEVIRYAADERVATQCVWHRAYRTWVLRNLIFSLAMIPIMLFKPAGLWPSPEEMMADMLTAEGVTKSSVASPHSDNVSMSIRRNSIFGLIGPNGAGKTTFFNTLTGLVSGRWRQVHL